MIPFLFYTFYFLSCILYVEKLSNFRNNWQLRKARKMFQKSENGLNWKKRFLVKPCQIFIKFLEIYFQSQIFQRGRNVKSRMWISFNVIRLQIKIDFFRKNPILQKLNIWETFIISLLSSSFIDSLQPWIILIRFLLQAQNLEFSAEVIKRGIALSQNCMQFHL